MARLTVTRGWVNLEDSLPFAVEGSGQSFYGTFTLNAITVQVPGGGTGTYHGTFRYSGNAILGNSIFTSYVHDTPRFGYSLSGIKVSVGTYVGYLDAGNPTGLLAYIFRSSDVMVGGAEDDVLFGYAGNDRLEGGAGSDQLAGGSGRDTLIGGTGNDFYVPDGDTIVEAAGGGTADTVVSETSYTLKANLERLFLLEEAGDARAKGNESANDIYGNSGNNELLGQGGNDLLKGEGGDDILDGGAGNDRLDGSTGNDVYFLRAGQGSDTILDKSGEDTVKTSLNNYILGAKLENLVQLGTAKLTSTGNSLDNDMAGNDGHSRLRGGDGNDLLSGGLGNDTLEGQNHDDTLNGEDGADSLVGGSGNDVLDGGAGMDRLLGGDGDDTLVWDDSVEDVEIHGEGGSDTLELSGTANLDLATVTTNITGVDAVLLEGTNTLQLDAARVVAVSDAGTLRINGGDGDQVTATDAWVSAGTTTLDEVLYNVFTSGDATLHLQDGLAFDYLQQPAITFDGGGDSASVTVDENNELVATVTSTGQGEYSITGGADADLFTIDAESGELSFIAGPDFENPADADLDNVYEVTVQAANELGTDTQAISVTVSDSPAPAITSDGGGDSAGVIVFEEDDQVTTVTSTSAVAAYSITGGADAALFTIDAASGELSFDSEIDFENPADADGDNVYEVTVQASDPEGTDTQAISVTVTDTPPPPVGDVTVSGPGGRYVFSPGDFSAGDYQAIMTSVFPDPEDGVILLGEIAEDAQGFIFYSALENGQLTFDQASGATGTASYSYQVQNSLGVVDPTIYTVTINLLTFLGNNIGDDSFTGTAFSDTISGIGGADTLDGGGSADLIWGGLGADSLVGGAGNDTIHAGYDGVDTDADRIAYKAFSEGGDLIQGFSGPDRIVFSGPAAAALDDTGFAGDLDFIVNTGIDLADGIGSDACLITAEVSALSDADLLDLSAVAGEIRSRFLFAAEGNDGLFVIQGVADTGVYYYKENGNVTNHVSVGELTRIAIIDGALPDPNSFGVG